MRFWRRHTTEENRMSSYGPQGSPVTVSSTPPEPQPEPTPVAPEPVVHNAAALPGGASVVTDAVGTEVPAESVEEALLRVTAERDAAKATIAAATRLITSWSNAAEGTLVKNDYLRGQRDDLHTRVDELRKVLGL
jgi:hypothetical protein